MQVRIDVETQTALKDGRRRGWFWDCNEVFGSGLSSNAILVRLYIARRADRERQAFPSLNTIAKDCGISRSTVKRALNELEEKGWLTRNARRRWDEQLGGEHLSTLYVLLDPPRKNNKETLPMDESETLQRWLNEQEAESVNQVGTLRKVSK